MALARIDTPLKRVLHEEGRRQDWLASQVGVRPEQVWRWVHGLHEPADDTKQAIAEALGRTVEELFPEEPVAA